MTQTSAATQPAVDPTPPRTVNQTFAVIGVALIMAMFAIVVTLFLSRNSTKRPALNDQQITQALRDTTDPDSVIYALQQVSGRIAKRQNVSRWYPELVALASDRNYQVQHRVAALMGQDPRPEFHEPLLSLLRGNSLLVRNTAALSLAQFNDSSGREQILSMLHPEPVTSPAPGKIEGLVALGAYVTQGDVIAKLHNGGIDSEVRSPVTGTIRSLSAQDGDVISAGIDIAVVEPGAAQVIAALRALERVGYIEDVEMIKAFASDRAPEDVRQQALATQKGIRTRARK